MIFLLDVNVLIALIDSAHLDHDRAHEWFAAEGKHAWATCPMTENAVLRILGHTSYPNSPGPPAMIAPILKGLRSASGHQFWADDISMADEAVIDSTRLLNSGQITDAYLLALAKSKQGKLASFDRRLVVDAVVDGKNHFHLIA